MGIGCEMIGARNFACYVSNRMYVNTNEKTNKTITRIINQVVEVGFKTRSVLYKACRREGDFNG